MTAGERLAQAANSQGAANLRTILQLVGIPLIVTGIGWLIYTFDDQRFKTRDLQNELKALSEKIESNRIYQELRTTQLVERQAEHRAEINRIWAEVMRNQSRVDRTERALERSEPKQ